MCSLFISVTILHLTHTVVQWHEGEGFSRNVKEKVIEPPAAPTVYKDTYCIVKNKTRPYITLYRSHSPKSNPSPISIKMTLVMTQVLQQDQVLSSSAQVVDLHITTILALSHF